MPGSDYKWIYVGCIIPDIPWILQRVMKLGFPDIPVYDLRLYVIVQASFCVCLFLSLVFAVFSTQFWKTFIILALNSFFHLLLDACQIKWANGVHFLAPFNWQLTNFGLFWPESIPTYLLTLFGLTYILWNWRKSIKLSLKITWQPTIRLFASITFILSYLFTPLFLLEGPWNADNHFVKTLRSIDKRTDSYVEFDRNSYIYHSEGSLLRTFAGEELTISGIDLHHSASISVRGYVIEKDKLLIDEYHVHSKWFRDSASYLGLVFIGILWGYILIAILSEILKP